MEMIDRYLQAVKFALPQAQRDDIIKELRDSILSQIEDKEATLGRSLDEDEQAELLKKLGSPIALASRYRRQQFLIGATMFPIYWKVLKTSLALAFVVLAAASIATAAAGKTLTESLGVLFRYPSVALMTFAWITMVFSALEFFGARLHLKDRWDPRKLAAVGQGRSPQVAIRADRTTSDSNTFQRLVAGRTALPVPRLRTGHCLPQVWSGMEDDLSIVCGAGDRRPGPHRIQADLAAMDAGWTGHPPGNERTLNHRPVFPDRCARLVRRQRCQHSATTSPGKEPPVLASILV
jgi:hypothetical protein